MVGGGLCKGTLGKDGIIVWRRDGNGRAIWVKVFVVGSEGRGSRFRVSDGRDEGKGSSGWKWAWDCHKMMFDNWGRGGELEW